MKATPRQEREGVDVELRLLGTWKKLVKRADKHWADFVESKRQAKITRNALEAMLRAMDGQRVEERERE